jgi:PAS domain S-box-containing protein
LIPDVQSLRLHSVGNGDAFFHQLVEQAPMAIFVQTDGRIAYANPAACALFGAPTPEALIGTPVLERFLPDARERLSDRIRRLSELRERAETSQQEFLRLDGSRGFGETSAMPFVHEGRDGALVFLRDLTQQRQDQQTARAREELLRLTGKLAKVGGWAFDALTLEGTWTEEVARIHDLDPDLPTDLSVGIRYYTPDSRRRVEEAIGRALQEAAPYDLELEMVTAAGNHKWVRTKGFPELVGDRVVAVRGIFQDITEAKLAQARLAEEKERLAVTLRSIGDGVIATDTAGNVTMLNPVAEELTGWRSEEARGRPLTEVFVIFNELTRKTCEDPVAKVLKTGLVVELANHTCLLARDGRERSIADSGAPILDDKGNILGVVLVFRDVTEKHKLDESMHRAQNLESIGVLAGGIAHDFNNLLSGIFGNICLAQDATKDGNRDEALRSLTRAIGIFERAKALTQQLLTFSKGGTPVRELQQIGSLVRKSANFALSGSNVSADVHLESDLWTCDCDPNQIGQVIDNIVINAQQAMPEGGVVTIGVHNHMVDDSASSHEERRGPYVHIRIQDNGGGIPKDILPRIFDPFFSTKTTGHGLGLATVHSIVQRHDGWIDVASDPHQGTTFDIYLPAHQEPSDAGPDSEISASPWAKGQGRVLIMDDEDYIAEFLQVVLESLGYSVVSASNGRDAVEAFRKAQDAGAPFRLCILDLTIPGGMGGIAAAQEMREIGAESRFVAASGYSDDPVVADPAAHGFHDSLRKPFLKADLVTLLERVLQS